MPFPSVDQVSDKTFDYVIVGGGTAGLTLAARLSEDPDTSVVVLEAGANNTDHPLITKSSQPALHFGNSDLDWAFETIPQKHSLDVVQICHSDWIAFRIYRGKGLGGSSSTNFQCWTHPPKEDIDNWERLGNPGWNWEMFEKYANQVYTVSEPRFPDGWKIWDASKPYGNGPLSVILPNIPKIDVPFRETLHKLGIPQAPAPYHGNPRGANITLSTYHATSYLRSSSATAYLLPNIDRPNLVVLLSALGHRLIFDDNASSNLVAKGVEFSCGEDKTPRKVYAKKEVVLCAGTLKSPQILELSGIGRADVLRKIGVPLKLELPGVGENIQEHQIFGMAFELKDQATNETFDILRDEKEYLRQGELLAEGKGLHTIGVTNLTYMPLSAFCGIERAKEIYAAEKKKIAEELKSGLYPPGLKEQYDLLLEVLDPERPEGHPSVEIIGFPGYQSFPKAPIPGKKYYSLCSAINHNFSRGTVHATSNDPFKNPEIDPHHFEHDIEAQNFVEVAKFLRKLAQTAPLSDILKLEYNPGAEVQSQEDLEDWIKKGSITAHHTIGSCSMLPRELNGVVDANLKVYGTKNVRVADLSIVPLHFAAHTQSTAYVIGERAADIIREASTA
ncbi:hypothetical protein D9758_015848 [Tetrapyrgos nigripes]|uniref:Glucose-methanol-choline oxidoreductase N-terminal domain-containing protein n=1 Tax=Tetrapyrgos nigripes TaxID=182062 RepID=A0A8H5FHJ0_9AGAR|nr:hypothetical protein D9758_015848 [Tetrapyrgos nigripes]